MSILLICPLQAPRSLVPRLRRGRRLASGDWDRKIIGTSTRLRRVLDPGEKRRAMNANDRELERLRAA